MLVADAYSEDSLCSRIAKLHVSVLYDVRNHVIVHDQVWSSIIKVSECSGSGFIAAGWRVADVQ